MGVAAAPFLLDLGVAFAGASAAFFAVGVTTRPPLRLGVDEGVAADAFEFLDDFGADEAEAVERRPEALDAGLAAAEEGSLKEANNRI